MPRPARRFIIFAAVATGLVGCASSFGALDRSANALAQKLEDDGRCYSRSAPNGQTTAGCTFWEKTTSTTTTTTTTTEADGTVTTTSTTRTVDDDRTP